MKTKELNEAMKRGDRTFAVKRDAERGTLVSFTVDRFERGLAVHARGGTRRPTELMPLGEAEAMIAERDAANLAEQALRDEADELHDALADIKPSPDADDPDMVLDVRFTLAQARWIVGSLRTAGLIS